MKSNLTPNQEQMVYWITEREKIRLAKEAGQPAPWSDNKVMQETYFCNVNREDDKVTRWIRENWTYRDGYKASYTFALVVARIFNLPDTLADLGQPDDDGLLDWQIRAENVLWDRHLEDKRIWNGAYIISTNGKKMSKIDYCLYLLAELASEPDVVHNAQTLSEAHQRLMKVEGLASFLAAQVVADLKNTHGHQLQQAPDWRTFSAYGPGSLRGLSWFFETEVTRKTYQARIDEAYDILEFELPDTILDILCHQNLQNCFCEYDKFMRVTNGTGRSKRKYRGTGE